MAAFFPPHVPAENPTRQPIKLSGFSIPSTSTSSAPPTLHHSNPTGTPSGHSSIDPSILFGLTSTNPSNWNGFSSLSSFHAGGGGGGGANFGSSSVLTDTDLDIENMLASFSEHHAAANGGGPANLNGDNHFFGPSEGQRGGGGGGAMQNNTAAGSNGFLGATSMSYPGQYSSVRHGSISAQGQTSPHFFGINTSSSQDHAHPPSSVAAIPHFASHSPALSSSAISAADFFPPLTKDSPLTGGGGGGVSTDPSSYASDAFSPPTSKRSPPTSSNPTSRGREGRSLSRGSAGGGERAGSRSRSTAVSAGVGKAPRTTSRSRSARRNSSAAGYQDRPSPSERGGSNAGTPSSQSNPGPNPNPNSTSSGSAATANAPSASHGSAAIIIPSSTPSIPLPSPSQQYSSSMPAYSSAAANPSSLPSSLSGAGAVGNGWFSQAGLSFLPSFPVVSNPLKSVPEKEAADPVTGWRPSQGIVMPASAPPTTSASSGIPKPVAGTTKGAKVDSCTGASTSKGKKNQTPQGLEDVQEEEGDEKPSGKADPAEKRRKRRESHNLVERRRRDNINDRIAELSSLLPETFINSSSPPLTGGVPIPRRSSSSSNQGGAGDNGGSPPGVGALSLMSPPPPAGLSLFSTSPVGGGGGASLMAAANQASNPAVKINKGVVLAKSVDYIRYLLENIELQTQQIAELQRQNRELQAGNSNASGNPAALSSSQPQFSDHQHRHQQQQQHQHPLAQRPQDEYFQQQPPQFAAPERAHYNSRGAHLGEWAAFEDEDVGGNDVQFKREEERDMDEEDEEGMDES